METTGCDAHVVALAVKVNGDVTLAPSKGVTTEMPEASFALMGADGVEHPEIANAMNRPMRLDMDIRTIPHFPAQDCIRGPHLRARSGCEKKQNRLELTESPANARRETVLALMRGPDSYPFIDGH